MSYYDDRDEIYDTCEALQQVASNLFAVGLDVPATAIRVHVVRIRERMDRIDEQQLADLHRGLEVAQQSSVNVLNAVLSGIEIGKRGDHA